MTRTVRLGLVLALSHVLIAGSGAAKYGLDRITRPRVWARAAPYDPDLPIRGRYARLRIEAATSQPLTGSGADGRLLEVVQVRLSHRDGALFAEPVTSRESGQPARFAERNGARIVILSEPLAYFIPEHVEDPSRRASGEELWVEVTLPRGGPPRPIQLGVRRGGSIEPLLLQ